MENEAFQYINLLYIDYDNDPPQELIGSIGVNEPIDMSNKIIGDSFISWIFDSNNEHEDILFEKSDYRIRFGNINYRKYKEFINRLSENIEFKGNVTLKFLEEEVFKWLIDIKENGVVKKSLFSYLNERIENEKKEQIFYFPIENLEIEKMFTIGYVEFIYFTKEHWDKVLNESDFDKQFIDGVFRENYQGKVLASVKIKGVSDNAELLAKKQVELAIDTLKLLGPTIPFPKRIANFNLDYRLNYLLTTEYLTRASNDELIYSITKKGNYNPTRFTIRIIDGFQEENKKVSNFILSMKETEIDRLIRQSINLLANCLTLDDLHFRIANLFTLLESICLEENREYKITSKTIARIPKLITQDFKDKEFTKELIKEFYEIRHKFIHKANRLSINLNNLGLFQHMIKYSILSLINNRHFVNKKTLIKVLDEIKT